MGQDNQRQYSVAQYEEEETNGGQCVPPNGHVFSKKFKCD